MSALLDSMASFPIFSFFFLHRHAYIYMSPSQSTEIGRCCALGVRGPLEVDGKEDEGHREGLPAWIGEKQYEQ